VTSSVATPPPALADLAVGGRLARRRLLTPAEPDDGSSGPDSCTLTTSAGCVLDDDIEVHDVPHEVVEMASIICPNMS